MANLWIVIPAKDEADTIGRLVTEAAQYGTVLVVNDGSRDDTGPIAAKSGGLHLRHVSSCGIGLSIMDGWRVALANGAEWILVMDAGGSHDPRDIPKFPAFAGLNGTRVAHIVIGSRFVPGGRYYGRWWRKACSRFMALLCNLSQSGKWLHDWSSGFRLYSAGAVRQLLAVRYQAKMHAWQIEVLGWARFLHLSIKETPITYVAGQSSLSWSGVLEAALVWLQILHHRQVTG